MKRLHTLLLTFFFVGSALAQQQNTSIATTTRAGKVKPDGSTITVDPDGTIHDGGGPTNGLTILQYQGANQSGTNNFAGSGGGLTNLNAANVTNAVATVIYLDAVLGGQPFADGKSPWRALASHAQAGLVNYATAVWDFFPGTYPTNSSGNAVTNNIWKAWGALIPYNRSGHLLDLYGNFSMEGGTLFDANLNNSGLHFPLYFQDVTSTVKLKLANIYGLSDCLFKQSPGSDSTNFTVLYVDSCVLTSKWDDMVFLNYSGNAWGSNYVVAAGSDFIANGDTNFYGAGGVGTIGGIGGHNVHIVNAPGRYKFFGDSFYNRNAGAIGTFGIKADGPGAIVDVAGCVFDIASTNGPAYWLYATNTAVINYYGSPLPTNYWATAGGGVINFISSGVPDPLSLNTLSVVNLTSTNMTGNAGGLTNMPFTSLSFSPVTSPFTNVITAFLRFTNGGTVYTFGVGTNL